MSTAPHTENYSSYNVKIKTCGRPISLCQNGEQWTFDYDGVGRLNKEVGFDGRTREYTYDEGGMLFAYSEGDHTTLYERDSTGLLTRKVTERTGHGIVETRYAHDMLGRLTSVKNSHSAVRLHYDALDNLIAEEQTADLPDGYHYRSVYRHTYDVLGNRQTTTLPNGQEVARAMCMPCHLIVRHCSISNATRCTAKQRATMVFNSRPASTM